MASVLIFIAMTTTPPAEQKPNDAQQPSLVQIDCARGGTILIETAAVPEFISASLEDADELLTTLITAAPSEQVAILANVALSRVREALAAHEATKKT